MKVYKVRCIKNYKKYSWGNENISFYKNKFYDLEIISGDYIFEYTVISYTDEGIVSEGTYFIDEQHMNEYFLIDIKETRKQKLNIINKIYE